MIEHILAKGEVWIAPLEEIAAHVRQVAAAGTYTPSVQTLPIRDGRITDIPDPYAGR